MIINIVLTKMMLRINLTAGGGGGGYYPQKNKTSAPEVFSRCSFIPRADFETSLVMVSCYGYAIRRHKYQVVKQILGENTCFFQLLLTIKLYIVARIMQSAYLCVIQENRWESSLRSGSSC